MSAVRARSDRLPHGALLSEFAPRVGMTVVRDGRFSNLALLGTDEPGALVSLYSASYADLVSQNREVAAVLTSPALAGRVPPHVALAVASDPLATFLHLHAALHEDGFYWRDFDSEISPSARVHPRAWVAPRNVRIAEDVTVGPLAVIEERTEIAAGSTVGAGTVVGAEGFQVPTVGGVPRLVVHAGGVRIGRGVDIQSNTVVDRSLFGGFTEVGDDTKIDNLVHIAHGARIGRRCRIVASVVIAGGARLMDDVWVGPNAAVSSSVRVGKGAYVSLGAVVTRDVPDGARVSGNFAVDHDAFIRFTKSIGRGVP